MGTNTLYQVYKRYRTLQTHRISSLPIVILMPHSACNCRCVMCDIWKDNKNLKQLSETDIEDLLISLKTLGTQQVLMSGGEALLNPNFFRLSEMLKKQGLRISLLSTGLGLGIHAKNIVELVDDVIVSLDGDEELHDRIRNIPNAFRKMKEGIAAIRNIDDAFPVSSRTVIHRLNFRKWIEIISTARDTGIDRVSFLPADVSSHAFNREVLWSEQRQMEILLREDELAELNEMVEVVIRQGIQYPGFIAEDAQKLRNIHSYYSAFYGLNPFPYKKCNAPWVSAVVEADGTVRPCFFHAPMGNIRQRSLNDILNSEENTRFRKELDMDNNPICLKCVCYLNLSPSTKLN